MAPAVSMLILFDSREFGFREMKEQRHAVSIKGPMCSSGAVCALAARAKVREVVALRSLNCATAGLFCSSAPSRPVTL